jgi:hypothetical protein
MSRSLESRNQRTLLGNDPRCFGDAARSRDQFGFFPRHSKRTKMAAGF